MRGNELLDRFGGIDPRFLEEAYSNTGVGSEKPADSSPGLLDTIGNIDGKFLGEADIGEKKSPPPLFIRKKRILWAGAAAAAICALVVGGTFIGVIAGKLNNGSVYDPGSTSDKYGSLSELVEDLKDKPSSGMSQGKGTNYISMNVFGAESRSTSALVGDILCSTDGESISFYDLQSGSTEPISQQKGGGMLLSCGERLVSLENIPDKETYDAEWTTEMTVFSAENGNAAEEKISLGGYLRAGFEYNGLVYAVCTAGETEDHIPEVRLGEKKLSFSEDELVILGEPQTLNCTFITAVDPVSGEIKHKRAFYGDIASMFLGGDRIMLSTMYSDGEGKMTQAELYCFDKTDLRYRGSVSCADAFGIKPVTDLDDLTKGGVDIAYIDSADCFEDTVRIIGRKCNYKGTGAGSQERNEELFAMSFDLTSGEVKHSLLLPYEKSSITIDEATWEQERCIVTLSSYDSAAADMRTCFIFAEFDGDPPSLIKSDIKADHVTGIDMIYAGATMYGEHEAMIPLENGRYLRYSESSDHLDLYDLSDSNAPVLLKEGLCPIGNDRFEFDNMLYPDGQTLGIAVVKKGADNGYRDASIVWRVYRLDGEDMTMISETPISDKYSSYSSVDPVEYKGRVYYVCPDDKRLIVTG